jgi:eukaryotic-like serine/threonine-protein kinase
VIADFGGKARGVNEQNATPDLVVVGGRYELGAVLGTGASAQVRRAWDRLSGRAFAVKLFHAGASVHDRRRQQREMDALGALRHPGLVAMHDGGVEAGRPFIVTDLVDGPTLAACIAQRPLSPEQVLRIGADLADALAHVHAGGIVHRDLKPANVLLASDGRPRLADFGIARALDGTAVTGTGFVVGTAAYLAPEQVRGEEVGPAVDVYALGLVLLESLTGRREYPGALVESAMARLHRAPVIPEGLPHALATALHDMTALDPAARPTAAEVAALLRSAPTRRGRGLHRRGRGRHVATPRVAGLAAALAVAATVGSAAMPSGQPSAGQPFPSSWQPKEAAGRQADAAGWRQTPAAGPVNRVPASVGTGVAGAHGSAIAAAYRPGR